MKKLTDLQRTYLFLIDTLDGSFMPSSDADPQAIDILNDLVKAKCLTVETTDGGNRYHLTSRGKQEGYGDGPDKLEALFGRLERARVQP